MTTKVQLYKIPEVLEEAEILDDSTLPKYKESLKSMNPRAQATLGKYTVVDEELTHSSPLMQIHLLNSGALPAGTRLVTRQDLQTAIANDETGEFLRGRYTDFGIALRTARDSHAPNKEIAKRLVNQLKERGIALNEGVLIPIYALKDRDDSNEQYGVTLDLNDFATKDAIRDLREFKWDYARNEGLACAVLSYRSWYSDYENLVRSYDYGRVVVVRAVGASRTSVAAASA